MFVSSVGSLLLALIGVTANGMDANLQTFVQAVVPVGGIFFSGAVQTNEATYNLFVLEQDERRGVMVVANNSVRSVHGIASRFFSPIPLSMSLRILA